MRGRGCRRPVNKNQNGVTNVGALSKKPRTHARVCDCSEYNECGPVGCQPRPKSAVLWIVNPVERIRYHGLWTLYKECNNVGCQPWPKIAVPWVANPNQRAQWFVNPLQRVRGRGL